MPVGRPESEDLIRVVVTRLAPPGPAGGVVERAAILADGADAGAIIT